MNEYESGSLDGWMSGRGRRLADRLAAWMGGCNGGTLPVFLVANRN